MITNLYRRLKGIEHIADKRIARGKAAGDETEIRAGNAVKKSMRKAYKIVGEEICQCRECKSYSTLEKEREEFFVLGREHQVGEEDLLEAWNEYEHSCILMGDGGICELYDDERRPEEYCSRGVRKQNEDASEM